MSGLLMASACAATGAETSDGSNLPFNCRAPIRTYLHSAFATGIITRHSELRGPAFNHHVQLFFPAAKMSERPGEHVRFLPGMGLYDFAALGYLRLTEESREWLGAESAAGIIGRLAGSLAKGTLHPCLCG